MRGLGRKLVAIQTEGWWHMRSAQPALPAGGCHLLSVRDWHTNRPRRPAVASGRWRMRLYSARQQAALGARTCRLTLFPCAAQGGPAGRFDMTRRWGITKLVAALPDYAWRSSDSVRWTSSLSSQRGLCQP